MSDDDVSDQEDMDVSEIPSADGIMAPLPLPEGTESQALVPMRADGRVASAALEQLNSGTVSVYRGVSRTTGNGSSASPHTHFRLVPTLSTLGQTGAVVASSSSALPSAAQLPYPNVRAITAGNELAKFTSQLSNESVVSDGSLSLPAIHYDGSCSSSSANERVYVHESIISLLLRLHSRFNGNTDSYNSASTTPATTNTGTGDSITLNSFDDQVNKTASTASHSSTLTPEKVSESRIGDGTFWIGKVLDKLSRLDPRVRQCIQSTRMALWPPRTATTGSLADTSDELKEKEKKRKIRERQQRLLLEFANKQKQFMQQAMAEDMDTDQEASAATEGACASGVGETGEASDVGENNYTATEELLVEEYDCVICNQASASTAARPMCLVVLLQATSVLSHRRQYTTGSDAGLTLPVSDDDRLSLNKTDALSVEMDRRVENLRQHFSEPSWLLSLNIGYEGGVYVHTCGHYLHLDCHKQYLQSLRSQQRQQSLNVERGEYSCPLCRQLANSALPIATQLIHRKFPHRKSTTAVCALAGGANEAAHEIYTMFNREPPLSLHAGSNLMEAMGRVMEDMTNATYPRFRQITTTPSPASLFLFVQSIARTNLEIELLQRGDSITRSTVTASQLTGTGGSGCDGGIGVSGFGASSSPIPPGTSSASWNSPGLELRFSSSPTPGASTGGIGGGLTHTQPWSLLPKRSCLLPLLHVLATHSKILTVRPYSQLWSQISGLNSTLEGDPHGPASASASSAASASVSRCEKQVPLLVQDMSCLLLQMVLVLPLPLERRHFTCLIQRLFNVVAVQIAAQLTCQLGEKKRKLYKILTVSEWNLEALVSCVVGFLDSSHLYMEDEDEASRESKALNVEVDIQQPLYNMALHFLQIAALLQHHLFGDPLPSSHVSKTDYEEFIELSSYLNISYQPKFDASLNPRLVIRQWCHEFRVFLARSPLVARSLLLQHRPWKGPRLLVLPHSYDTLFQVRFFHGIIIYFCHRLHSFVIPQYYHHKSCPQCNSVPKEPSLCLVCGALVCLRENCCKEENMHEAVQV